MARNGQRKYSSEFVQSIVLEYLNTKTSYTILSRKYHVPSNTISQWVYKLRKGIDVVNSRKKGRRKYKNLTLDDYKERYEILKKYQAFLQARQGKK